MFEAFVADFILFGGTFDVIKPFFDVLRHSLPISRMTKKIDFIDVKI